MGVSLSLGGVSGPITGSAQVPAGATITAFGPGGASVPITGGPFTIPLGS